MDAISHEYTKQRREFGRHPNFSDSKTETVSIQGTKEDEDQWILRRATTVNLECIPQMSEHWVQTERIIPVSRGMQHTRGGWPYPEVKTNEPQEIERFVGRIEIRKDYQQAVRKLCRTTEKVVQQNNTIDMFEEYFTDVDLELSSEPPSAKTLSVFRDPHEVKRSATKISWHPDGSPKIAVAYSSLKFQQMPSDMSMSSYIWDVNSPNEPDFEIIPQSPLCTLVYNPRSTDHLVGGSYNGLIGFWDLRKGNQPIEYSTIEQSHHEPVYDIFWIQSRTGNECCSCSTDGQLLWWDVRKLKSGPTDSMQINGPNGSVYGATRLEYRTDAGATRFLVGTEQGQGVLVDRKAKKDAESTKSIKTIFGMDSGRHFGPMYSLQRHPFAPKYFLSVGDWTTKIWMEDIKSPIMTTPYDTSYLTAGCWSPTRPGVFFTTKNDGTLNVWDYYYKQNDPAFTTKITDSAITALSVATNGTHVALGSEDGTTTILQISESLAKPQPNEKAVIQQMFERETRREKALEIRYNIRKREANLSEKKKDTSTTNEKAKKKEMEKLDKILKEAEDDFFQSVNLEAVSLDHAHEQKQKMAEDQHEQYQVRDEEKQQAPGPEPVSKQQHEEKTPAPENVST